MLVLKRLTDNIGSSEELRRIQAKVVSERSGKIYQLAALMFNANTGDSWSSNLM